MKRYLKYLEGVRLATIIAPILMIIDAMGSIVQPYFMARIIDVGIANSDMSYIVNTGLIMVLFAILAMMSGFGCMYFSAKAAYGFSANLRKDMVSKIQEFYKIFTGFSTLEISIFEIPLILLYSPSA